VVVCASLFGLAACGSDDEAQDQPAASGPKPYRGDFATIGYNAIMGMMPFHIAETNGYYADAKLEMTPVEFTSPSDLTRATATQMHLGTPSSLGTIVAHAKGLPELRIVASLEATTDYVYLVKPDSPIESPADLKGKKVGVSDPTALATYFASIMVREAGLTPDEDVTFINVKAGADAATALEQGVVDVAWSAAPLSIQLINEGKARSIFDASEQYSDFITSVLVSDTGFIEKNRDVVQRMVDVLKRSCEFVNTSPAEAADIWADSSGLDPKTTKVAIDRYKEAFHGNLDLGALEQVVKAAVDLGLIDKAPVMEELVDLSFTTEG
jgi:NitT/TauT family transport system substrate-binding protein